MGGGSFVTAHLDRGRDKWNQVRRVRELAVLGDTTRKPVVNNEPIGAAESSQAGRRESDPAFFFCMGALNRVFEVGGVFHSEAGLNGALPGPVQQACAEAFVEGSRIVPADDRLVFKNATWADSPVVKARFDDTIIRAYTGVGGSAAWTVLVGLSGIPASSCALRGASANASPSAQASKSSSSSAAEIGGPRAPWSVARLARGPRWRPRTSEPANQRTATGPLSTDNT